MSPPVYVGGWIETVAFLPLLYARTVSRHRCTSVAGLKRAEPTGSRPGSRRRHRCTSVAGLKRAEPTGSRPGSRRRHRCTSVAGLKRFCVHQYLSSLIGSPPVYVGGWIETGGRRVRRRRVSRSRHRCTSVAGLKLRRLQLAAQGRAVVATGVRRWLD